MTSEAVLWVIVAYVAGSIPFSLLVVRWITGVDVRAVGSGNPGATNALRAGGRVVGLLALAGDFGKGAIVVVAARFAGNPPVVVNLVAAAVVLGHVYSLFLRFRGGKGVAPAAGALGALAPLAFLGSLAVFFLTVATTRYVSLGSILAVTTFPLILWGLAQMELTERHEPAFLASATLIPALVVWRHRGNVARLLAGTERRIERKATRNARTNGHGAGP